MDLYFAYSVVMKLCSNCDLRRLRAGLSGASPLQNCLLYEALQNTCILPSEKICEILTDIFMFIYLVENAGRKATCWSEHGQEYPLLRCLSDEQLSEVEVSSRKNRQRQKLQRVPREMKINFRVIWLLNVNEWKSMQSQMLLSKLMNSPLWWRCFLVVDLHMQTKHSDSQISPFQLSG